MASLPGLIAHGGSVGAIVESLVVVAVTSVLVAVWIRERRARREHGGGGPAALNRDE